jgi:hypothetical protein
MRPKEVDISQSSVHPAASKSGEKRKKTGKYYQRDQYPCFSPTNTLHSPRVNDGCKLSSIEHHKNTLLLETQVNAGIVDGSRVLRNDDAMFKFYFLHWSIENKNEIVATSEWRLTNRILVRLLDVIVIIINVFTSIILIHLSKLFDCNFIKRVLYKVFFMNLNQMKD